MTKPVRKAELRVTKTNGTSPEKKPNTTTTASKRDREIPVQYAACRTFLHAWDFTTVDREGGLYIQGLRCLRCGTERHVKINARTGEPKGNKYDYPDGYLITGGALTARERWSLRLSEVKRHGG